MWKNTDPRYDIDKCAEIVIFREDLKRTCLAHVDTEEIYNIFTGFDGYESIDVDMNWDPSWWWTFTPNKFNKNV